MNALSKPHEQTFVMTPDAGEKEVFHSFSRAMCPTCRQLVDASRVIRGGKVWLKKQCPTDGPSEALISGDSEWFLKMFAYVKPGSIPLQHSTPVKDGCPKDCGLCADHEQHTCLPIIEITNHCNLECPICIVQNKNNYMMSREEFVSIIDGLVKKEGQVETVNLSGGEPTIHPLFLEFLDLAKRPEIARVSISTNGLRIATDFEFCKELARRGVYVNLQLDAMTNPALRALRGPGDQAEAKRRALENLEKAGVRTTIISTLARGVNDDQIGDCIKLLFEKDFILSLLFQPAAYTGYGGSHFAPHQPHDVMTISDVVREAELQTDGVLQKKDFLPLPCSHPACFGLTYLLRTQDGFIPFPRFLPLERYMDVASNRGTIKPDDDIQDLIAETIDELWTGNAQIPDSTKILHALKKALCCMFPQERALEMQERLLVGEGMVKTIFIHAFMDEHTFEVDRIKKCCTHYAMPDGKLMPGCAYNMFYRHIDPRYKGEAGKPAIWGKTEAKAA